jgi:Flp pilus assembly CpaE family ATPase
MPATCWSICARLSPVKASVRAVVFDFSGQMAIPHESLEKFLNHTLTAILPVSLTEMNQAVNKSIPLVQLNAHAKASLLIRQIAQQLIKA